MRGRDPIREAWATFLFFTIRLRQSLEQIRDSLIVCRKTLGALHNAIEILSQIRFPDDGELVGKVRASIREMEELGRGVQAAWAEAELEVRIQRVREALEYVTRGPKEKD